MIMSIIIMVLAFLMVMLMSGCYMKLDQIEKHDYAVKMRWAKREESEPPEWADPEKWWESELPIYHVGYDDEQIGREK